MAHKDRASNWRSAVKHLPITPHLERLTDAIQHSSVSIIEAPPGSGKTTVLPLHLLEQEWLSSGSIVMLQPRRIAAKSVATRMAELLAEEVGDTVGYQVRLDTCRSSKTRIEVITEGLLTKRLLADPALDGVKVLILDEFHERSIQADVALALALESASVLRPDLKIVVMSATLGESLSTSILKDARKCTFEGTPHPVSVHYEPGEPRTRGRHTCVSPRSL
jgi:ATP-dependent helicase HrpB